MSTSMIIRPNSMSSIEVSIGNVNKYDAAVQVKFTRKFDNGSAHGTDEMYMTATQLESLGKFLIQQAKELHTGISSDDKYSAKFRE